MIKRNFIERSLMGSLSFLKNSLLADEIALKSGFLQILDPRIKLASFLIFIILAVSSKKLSPLIWLYLLCLCLAAASKISLWFFLKRTWIFIPLFSFFIAVPALFSFCTPGQALWTWNLCGVALTITRQGLDGSLLFVSRVASAVSFAVLLSLTTRHFVLLRVLRLVKVPSIFVSVLQMCHRYLFLLVDMMGNTYLAMKSRAGTGLHHARGQKIVAWNIASFWKRSSHLNEEVYRAMLSRGYTGEPVTIDNFQIRTLDGLWMIFSVELMTFFIVQNI